MIKLSRYDTNYRSRFPQRLSKNVEDFRWEIYHSFAEKHAMLPPPFLPSPCSAVGRIAGPFSQPGPSLLFFLLTLSFSLSPSYTDCGRFQPSSRLPLMDRRLCWSGSRVRHRVDRVVGFSSLVLRNSPGDRTSFVRRPRDFPDLVLPEVFSRSPARRELSDKSPRRYIREETFRRFLPLGNATICSSSIA